MLVGSIPTTRTNFIRKVMQITILNVTTSTVPTAKGSYEVAEVAYKDETGKVNGKKIMSFTNKEVFKVLKDSKSGDLFTVSSEKDEKGYWEIDNIIPIFTQDKNYIEKYLKVEENVNTIL